MALPVIVKPNRCDNSEGVTLVRHPEAYAGALAAAFAYDDQVMVEEYIELGREVRCAMVARQNKLIGLPLEEYFVESSDRPIRTQAHKLKRNAENELIFTAKGSAQSWIVDRDDPDTERVWEAAERCHHALGCRHYSLFDFRIDPAGQPWFIEAGLYCSFSPQSVMVTMMAAAGTPLNEFFDTILREVANRPVDETM